MHNHPFAPGNFGSMIATPDVGCCGSGHAQHDSRLGGLESQGQLIRPDHNIRRTPVVSSLDLMGGSRSSRHDVGVDINDYRIVTPPLVIPEPDPDFSWMDRSGLTCPVAPHVDPDPDFSWMDLSGPKIDIEEILKPDPTLYR